MTYQTTITQKGQIVIPIEVRRALGFKPKRKIIIEVDIKKKEVRLRPTSDVLEMAGKIKPRKVVNALQLRDTLEKGYERI